MWRGRRERRIRERGAPAPAVVVDAAPLGSAGPDGTRRFRLQVTVEPPSGPPFPARLELSLPEGSPPVAGARLDVLHDGRRAIAVPGAGLAPPPPPPPDASEPPAPPPPMSVDLVGEALRRLVDGSLRPGGPPAVFDTGPPADADTQGPGLADRTVPELVALAAGDPDRVGDEVLRRVVSGEASFGGVLAEAHECGEEGPAAIRAVLDRLHARGLIGDAPLRMLRRIAG
jgi:hypothetical protein